MGSNAVDLDENEFKDFVVGDPGKVSLIALLLQIGLIHSPFSCRHLVFPFNK